MGMSPTAELGEHDGFFQAAHGAPPDIAGQGVANPLGTILSGALMLTWLGERHADAALLEAARRIDAAVERMLGESRLLTQDLGGTASTGQVTGAVCEAL